MGLGCGECRVRVLAFGDKGVPQQPAEEYLLLI